MRKLWTFVRTASAAGPALAPVHRAAEIQHRLPFSRRRAGKSSELTVNAAVSPTCAATKRVCRKSAVFVDCNARLADKDFWLYAISCGFALRGRNGKHLSTQRLEILADWT